MKTKLQFAKNTRVIVREQGLGKIVGFGVVDESGAPRPAAGEEPPDFYVVQTRGGTTLVRIATAAEVIRKLIPSAQAPALLRILRQKTAPRLDLNRLIARSKKVTTRGSAKDHVLFLRCLYERTEIGHGEAIAILLYEDLVLDELAVVMKRKRGPLEAEMRRRYPAMQRRIEANRLQAAS